VARRCSLASIGASPLVEISVFIMRNDPLATVPM